MSSISNAGSVGVGQQDPLDANSDFTALDFIIRQRMALLDTIKPCQVKTVHAGTGSPPSGGTVDVQLVISQLDGAGNATPQGIVYGVPYFRIQGASWAIICDPAVGDIGFIACSDRDISSLKSALADGKSPMVNPGSNRKYNVSDGIYIGGFGNKVPKATAWFKDDGSFNISDKFGNVISSNSAGITATPANGGTFLVNGNFAVSGTVTASPSGATFTVGGNLAATGTIVAGQGGAGQVGLQTHTHTQAADSHGDTEQPTAAPTAGT
jgi:hypothetical protein